MESRENIDLEGRTQDREEVDREMMGRALGLARLGYGQVSPNPMVGAVITDPQGRIIGEGFHRQWGGPHAEVNAVRAAEKAGWKRLEGCTVYVTLEPCSHWGKTPPCASLLVEKGAGRVVVGCPDPFKEVSGRGVRMLREAGIEVTEGVLRDECEALNRKFIYAHTHGRPYVLLKWAQSADGFMAPSEGTPLKFSTPVSSVFMHRERAGYDAIMAGTGTLKSDDPSLTVRLWPGRRLSPVVYDPHGHVPAGAKVLANPDLIHITDEMPLPQLLEHLYRDRGVTSLMVEGGPTLLASFIAEGLWQEMRVEVSPLRIVEGLPAPAVALAGFSPRPCGGNLVYTRFA